MDIYKEITDLKEMWAGRSLVGKALLLFAFTLSVISVGSLADTVFAFKGFIVLGFDFYRELTEPIRRYISKIFSFEISQFTQDVFLLFSFWAGSIWRFDVEDPQREGVFWIIGFLVFLAASISAFNLVAYISNKYIAIIIVFPLAPLLHGVTCNKSFVIGAHNRICTYFMIGVYFFIACVAAISEGLTRPL